MADAVSVEIIGLEDVLKRLGNAASPQVLRAGMTKATYLVREAVAVYPPASHRPHGPWKSEKQRRYVMMLVSQGRVPYRRMQDPKSEQLGRKWTDEVYTSGTDVIGKVGNNVSYGPYVMGKETQAAYHVGTWPPAVDVALKHKDEIIQCFVDVVQDGLRG